MASTSYAAHGIDLKNGLSLKAAGLIAADTNGSGVTVGRGLFLIRVKTTAVEIASNDEIYNLAIEANTAAATSTWKSLGPNVVLSCLEANGGQGDSDDALDIVFAVFNPYDYQIRYSLYVAGSIATGANFTVDAYPVQQAAF